VKLLWFLLGLAVGLGYLVYYQTRLRLKLKLILHDLQVTPASSPVTAIGQLAMFIHQQQQTHQALTQQLETWQQILHAAPISYLQVDDENHLCWSNIQACQLLSIDPEKQGQKGRRLLLELVRSYELDRLIGEARATHNPCQKEWLFRPSSTDAASSTQQYPLRGYAFPLPAGHVGIFLEDRQEATTLAQERDRWASDVAHELKTPLTSIRLVAETLHTRVDSPLRIWVDRLLNETIRLSALVQDLLDLGRTALKLPQDLSLKTVDLPSLIQSAWLGLEPLAGKKQLWLDYSGPSSLRIQADEARLYRVLLNLLDNSIKYSPANQPVSVQVSVITTPHLSREYSRGSKAGQQGIQVDVIDSGPGFPEHALPHVFERFYRADPARSRGAGGPPQGTHEESTVNNSPPSVSWVNWSRPDWNTLPTASGDSLPATSAEAPLTLDGTLPTQRPSSGSGLGLAIVQQIVEAHGGSVRASNHPERGAWLQFFLPWQPSHQPGIYNTVDE